MLPENEKHAFQQRLIKLEWSAGATDKIWDVSWVWMGREDINGRHQLHMMNEENSIRLPLTVRWL